MAGPVLLWALSLAPGERQSRQVKIRKSVTTQAVCATHKSVPFADQVQTLQISSPVPQLRGCEGIFSKSVCLKGGKGELHYPEIFQIRF